MRRKPAGPVTTVIHVNTMEIKKNQVRMRRGDAPRPVVLARPKGGGKAAYGDTVLVKYKGVVVARVLYRPLEPLKSGAVAWVETECEVEVEAPPAPPPPAAGLTTDELLRVLADRLGPDLRRILDAKGG